MRREQISQGLSGIDDRYLTEAEAYRPARRWKWYAMAACVALAAAVTVWLLLDRTPQTVLMGGLSRPYAKTFSASESWVCTDWDQLLDFEQYPTVVLNGTDYELKSDLPLDVVDLGEALGTAAGEGRDQDAGLTYTAELPVRAITGIDQSYLIAVGHDSGWYVYAHNSPDVTFTLGQLLTAFDLRRNLNLTHFDTGSGHAKAFALSDDAALWEVLTACSDAPARFSDTPAYTDEGLSFSITSARLGVYKRFLKVSPDGTLTTNIFDYGLVIEIGPEAAARIIELAQAAAEECEAEPYYFSLCGTVTEMDGDTLLVDDSILCADPEEGLRFRVVLNDPRLSRSLRLEGIGIGDVVCVDFSQPISEDLTVTSARALHRAVVSGGDVYVAE